ALDPLLDGLKKSGLEHHLYAEVEADPSDTSMARASEAYASNNCTGLIAAGGGSTIDTAKAAGVLISNGGAIHDYFGFGNIPSPPPSLITVPTTAGTGSEVTCSAIVTDTGKKIKAVMASPLMFAQVAVVDPGLLAKMPGPVAAGTMMDALTHAIESMGSPKAGPWTRALCLEAIGNIGAHARRFVNDPSEPEAASAISIASTWAGHSFTNTGLGIVHSLSHPIGSYHHVHHGTSNAIFLPPVMRFNLQAVRADYAQIAPLLQHPDDEKIDSSSEAAPQAAINAIQSLVKDIGIPATLREAGVADETDFKIMAKDAAESPQVLTNPIPASEADMLALLRAALDG
ncbi:MAG: iron-containing alcohol dehydrogenase, partial [Nitrospinaceae bacterium]|nr:iron-containing alcohol dehydrogenase [Nitrospinaceae bacterium]